MQDWRLDGVKVLEHIKHTSREGGRAHKYLNVFCICCGSHTLTCIEVFKFKYMHADVLLDHRLCLI
jgi:hypothetical protein